MSKLDQRSSVISLQTVELSNSNITGIDRLGLITNLNRKCQIDNLLSLVIQINVFQNHQTSLLHRLRPLCFDSLRRIQKARVLFLVPRSRARWENCVLFISLSCVINKRDWWRWSVVPKHSVLCTSERAVAVMAIQSVVDSHSSRSRGMPQRVFYIAPFAGVVRIKL